MKVLQKGFDKILCISKVKCYSLKISQKQTPLSYSEMRFSEGKITGKKTLKIYYYLSFSVAH